MPDSVIFDFDDTLADGHVCFTATTNRAAEKLGLRIPTETEIKHFGRSWEEFIHRNWPDLEVELFKREYFRSAKDIGCSALPGVIEALNQIRSSRQMYILSKKAKEMMSLRMSQTGISPSWFEGIYCNEDCLYKKPDPRTYDELLSDIRKKGDLDLSRIVAVGDHPDDYLAAEGAGFHFVGVLTGVYNREDFARSGLSADQVIESVAFLPEYLRKTNR